MKRKVTSLLFGFLYASYIYSSWWSDLLYIIFVWCLIYTCHVAIGWNSSAADAAGWLGNKMFDDDSIRFDVIIVWGIESFNIAALEH